MQYILTDIEGTSTSVAFVYEVLFPYFKENVSDYFQKNYPHPDLEAPVAAVRATVLEERGETIDIGGVVDQLIAWTVADRKHTALKSVQGLVWAAAYQAGAIKGHVYSDVPPALEAWKKAGYQLGVYSSGSVAAQQLLFGFSEFGDLKPYFSHYFDTLVGPKREAASYRNILAALNLPASAVLFLSDVEAELDAAEEAGMHTIQLVRPGTTASAKHTLATDFTEIDLKKYTV
jgi:enolase-phosphatase E1